MKKKYLIGLGIALASVTLSSCDKTYGYPKDVVDGFYSFDAHFSNGTNKTYKLNKDINAKVIGNCLVCDCKDECYDKINEWGNNYYYRFIIDIENNSFQKCILVTDRSDHDNFHSVFYMTKKVIKASNASIDRWIKETLPEFFKIEDEFKDLEYTYSIESYHSFFADATVTHCTSKYDNNGNEIEYIESDYEIRKAIMDYNENNQIISQKTYYGYDDSNMYESFSCEYTYDDANNLINEKRYDYYEENTFLNYEHCFQYDKDNHLICETMDYVRNNYEIYNENELCWVSDYIEDYKKEYTYDGNKLKYEHDVFYVDLNKAIRWEDEYYYNEEETKQIHKYKSLGTYLTTYTYALDGRVLSIDQKGCIGEEDEYHSLKQYEYDSNQNLIKTSDSLEYLNSELNESLHAGTTNEFYYYDSNNNLLKRISIYDFLGEEKKKYTSIYHYDSNGFLLKKEEFEGLYNKFQYSFEWTGDGIENIDVKENEKE